MTGGKYVYFVSYATAPNPGFGNCEISLDAPITQHEDVTVISEAIGRQHGTGAPVIVLNFQLLSGLNGAS